METEKRELIEQMKRLAAAYTPEWKFDEERPDIATALALICGELFWGTMCRFNRLEEKNRTAFFDTVGTRLRPSVPAQGYVTFGMSSDQMGGVEVPKGLLVLASEGDEEPVPFETQESVYVTPSALEEIILTDGKPDRIQQLYERPEEEEEVGEMVFDLFHSGSENLQEHAFLLGHNQVLNLAGPASVWLWMGGGRPGQSSPFQWLAQEEQVVLEYYSEEGFVEFERKYIQGEQLILEKGPGQPPFARMERGDREDFALRCRLTGPWNRPDFSVTGLRIGAFAAGLAPDTIQTDNGEEEPGNVFAFGERPAPYREVYIGADQVLSKAGSRVTVSFRVDYEKVPLELSQEPERDWKLVMKREDFIPDPEYDVTIERVVWEYFNGTGWSRLPLSEDCSRIFNGGDGTMGQQFTLEFICPPDADRFLYQSVESRYLRIRILKMNNLFKQKGNYITPVISDVRFSFRYQGKGKTPDFMEAFNNRESRQLCVKGADYDKLCQPLLWGIGDMDISLYLRFSRPLTQGPIRLLFTMEESIREELPRLEYEYCSDRGFAPLPLMDGTERMKKSGILTFMGRPDFKKAVFWGKEGYWLRIRDERGSYRSRKARAKTPRVNGIFLNAVRVRAVKTMPEEFFSIEAEEKNKVCRLLNGQVQNVEVWVDESRKLTRGQMEALNREGRAWEESDARGQLTRFWVRWTETGDFYTSGPEDRHYTVDRNQGTVTFSDGAAGAIPPAGAGQTIRIRYSCGGGEEGNQPPGRISQLSRSLGYVNQVTNPKIISGGSNQETGQEAMARSAKRLRHGGRAVTVSDYEDLAMEASPSVLKVKCFPGFGEDGRREPGSVTVVVLQKNFKNGRLYFDRVKQEVLDYVSPRLPGNQNALKRFYVAEPRYLELRCQIQAAVRDFDDAFDVKERLLARLEEFLDPMTGNFHKKGWDIGRIPNEIQITNAVKGIRGVRYIREVRLTAFMQSGQGWVEVDMDREEAQRFAVALSGVHQILITADNG